MSILRWDGSQWATVQAGEPKQQLLGAHGTAGNVTFVGANGSIQQWNGTKVSSVSQRADVRAPVAAYATSASTLWVVGTAGQAMRYNGAAWSVVDIGDSDVQLISVYGANDQDVWAVGYRQSNFAPVAFHFDGTLWNLVDTKTTRRLNGIWGSGSKDIWAIGDLGTVTHWDGNQWALTNLGITTNLNGITGWSTTSAVLVGSGNTVRRWDGTSWTAVAGATGILRAVGGTSGADFWVLAEGGTSYHYTGAAFTMLPTSITALPTAVWAAGASEVYLTYADGRALKWGGTVFAPFETGAANISGIAAVDAKNAWFVGSNGVLSYRR